MQEQPAPLTPEEQQALRTCEAEIRASLDKYDCDIQGVANLTTGNVVINAVIVKVRRQEAPAPPATGAAAAGAPSGQPA